MIFFFNFSGREIHQDSSRFKGRKENMTIYIFKKIRDDGFVKDTQE
jgi:hypothetical protein